MTARDRERGTSGDGRKERSRRETDATEPRKLRPLHTPSPMTVHTDGRGHPTAVGIDPGESRFSSSGSSPGRDRDRSGSRFLKVVQVREVWRIDDEWWRKPVSRLYFEVVLENGKRIVLYRDLVEGGWHRQRG